VEFFLDIHATVDHANNGNLIGIDSVKDQMDPNHETTEPGSKTRTFSANEWKSGQVLEIRVDPPNKSIGSAVTMFFEVSVNAK
jgi:hypothetical protein